MKTLMLLLTTTLVMIFNSSPAQAQLKETWRIKANYDTLPCLTIQQRQALKTAREDGIEPIVKEADIFHEATKKFFQTHKKFICPPVLEHPPKGDKVIVAPVGESNAFEVIYVVYQSHMEIMQGNIVDKKAKLPPMWQVRFDPESGVGRGKTKKKNEFVLVPLMPRDAEKSPYLLHSMKIPGHEKELVRICYPVEKKKECNPYSDEEVKPEF